MNTRFIGHQAYLLYPTSWLDCDRNEPIVLPLKEAREST